jgi:hypothetical protein
MRKEPQKKRVQPRYPTNGRFLGGQLPLHQSHRKWRAFEGKVKNISDGGFCVIATRAPERGGHAPFGISPTGNFRVAHQEVGQIT